MATDYQANIDALEEALGAGELVVQMPDGRKVQYRTIVEIKEAIAYNRKKLGGRVGTTYAGFGRRC